MEVAPSDLCQKPRLQWLSLFMRVCAHPEECFRDGKLQVELAGQSAQALLFISFTVVPQSHTHLHSHQRPRLISLRTLDFISVSHFCQWDCQIMLSRFDLHFPDCEWGLSFHMFFLPVFVYLFVFQGVTCSYPPACFSPVGSLSSPYWFGALNKFWASLLCPLYLLWLFSSHVSVTCILTLSWGPFYRWRNWVREGDLRWLVQSYLLTPSALSTRLAVPLQNSEAVLSSGS